jgi:hypothetical protein
MAAVSWLNHAYRDFNYIWMEQLGRVISYAVGKFLYYGFRN